MSQAMEQPIQQVLQVPPPAPATQSVQPSQTSVPNSFLKVPPNPNLVAAERAQQSSGASSEEPRFTQVSSGSQPQPAPVPAPTTTQQQVAPPADTSQYFQPQVPPIDPYLVQQLAREREELQRSLAERDRSIAERDTAINNLLADHEELNRLKQQQQTTNDINSMDWSQLEGVDEADAKRISSAALAASRAEIDTLRKELAQQRQTMQQYATYQQQQQIQQQARGTLDKILAKHPDFFQLQTTPAYQNYVRQRDGLTSKSIDQRAAEEFQLGNADYIIDLYDRIKGQQPNTSQIMSVAPVQTAASVSQPADAPEKLPTLRELNDLMQTRQITHDEYRAWLQKLRAAQ